MSPKEFETAYPAPARSTVQRRAGEITLAVPMREIQLSGGEPPLRVLRHQRPAGRRRAAGVATVPCRLALCPRRRRTRRALLPEHVRRTSPLPSAALARAADPARHPAGDAASLCAQGRRHARDGVHRAARRARRRVRAERSGAGPRDHSRQHQSSRARADDHRPQFPGEDQRQHRQLRGQLVDRGGSGEAAMGDAVGRRHRDGPVDRQAHPRDTRVDSFATRPCRSARCRSIRRSRKSAAGPRI